MKVVCINNNNRYIDILTFGKIYKVLCSNVNPSYILVKNDEQLLHLTRYLHLNPVTAKIVDRPEEWEFSSFNEYLEKESGVQSICEFKDLLDINPSQYRKFVNDQISYQRELAKIKKLLID